MSLIPATHHDLPDARWPPWPLSESTAAVIEPDDAYSFADQVGAKYGADLRLHDAPDRPESRSRCRY
jgi:hypothetical protein